MFTGIIEGAAGVKSARKKGSKLIVTFQKPDGWDDLKLGESVAVNGACLTVSGLKDNEFTCDLVAETLSKTVFGAKIPDMVNLERALAAGGRFSGHFVQGHVDGVGTVIKVSGSDDRRIDIRFDPGYKNLVIVKGSITVDGVSLTIASVEDSILSIALIPYTLKHTTLDSLRAGDRVNLEFDMLAKYVMNIVEQGNAKNGE